MIAYVRSPNAMVTVKGTSVFVTNTHSNVSVEMNEPERVVWELLDGYHTIQDIAEEVATRFGLSPAHSLAAVSTFVSKLSNTDCLDQASLVVERPEP